MEKVIEPILQPGFYIPLGKSISIFIIGTFITLLVAYSCRNILSKFTSKTKTETDDYILNVVIKTIKPLGLVLSFSFAWVILPFEGTVDTFFLGVTKLICLILIVRLLNKIVLRVIQRWALKIDDSSISSMLKSLSPMLRAVIWGIGSVFYLQNIGVQMAAIWALLSAGGIGAGLALKDPVQEFFEYITILLDKPFQNGEFINIDNIWATVERVGVRSTRLRSLSGEVIIMSNSALTSGVISNYAEMNYRRLVTRIGVVYETPVAKMKEIPGLIKKIVDSVNDASFDRCHFIEFGDFNLCFELVYYIPTSNYVRAMEAQQKINLEIMDLFEKENIAFAFPTQTINLQK